MSADEPAANDRPIKPLFWIASSHDDLRSFPEDVKDVIGYALYQAQTGGKHVSAKPLKGFGGAGVLDAFQKKSKKGSKTPPGAIERIKGRLGIAAEHYQEWRMSHHADEDEK